MGRSAAAAVAAARSVMLAAMSTGVAAQRAPQRPSGKEQTLSRAASHYASTTEGESRAEATMQMSRRRAVCDCRVKADCAGCARQGRRWWCAESHAAGLHGPDGAVW